MSTPTELASIFATECKARGFSFRVKGGDIVTVERSFAPGDRSAFVDCDCDGPSLLSMVPVNRPGSTWGTDGGSVGGMSAITNGRYYLNQSGVAKRFASALAKLA